MSQLVKSRRATLPTQVLAALVAVVLFAGVAVVSLPQATSRSAISRAVTLLSEQLALIMNGTGEPVITAAWIEQVMDNLVTPVLGPGYTGTAMTTPEEFWPITGLTSMTFNKSIKAGYELLDDRVHAQIADGPRTPLAVFGYSQSAIIGSVEKRTLAAEYADRKEIPPVTFTFIGNPLRPNGGFLSRLPIVADIFTPWTDMYNTPTDTQFATYDIAYQYDVWVDFPRYPLNLLADVNALFGLMNHWYVPESVNGLLRPVIDTVSLNPDSPNYNPDTVVQQYGDTTYYLVPSKNLPLFYPLRWVGLGPLVDVVEPLVRVFVELGYDRTTPYGEVARARLLPALDNLTVENARTFVSDVNDALQQGGEAFVDLFHPPHSTREEPSIAASTSLTPPTTVTAETSPLQVSESVGVKPVRSPKRSNRIPARSVSTPDSVPGSDTATVNPTRIPTTNALDDGPRLGGIPAAEDPREPAEPVGKTQIRNQQHEESRSNRAGSESIQREKVGATR